MSRIESTRLAENRSNCYSDFSAFKNGVLVLMTLFLTSKVRSTAFIYYCDLGSLLLSQQGLR